MMVWDGDAIKNLTTLWIQGLSTADIGRRLGVSKNSVVGKAHRLELDPRPSPVRRCPHHATDKVTTAPKALVEIKKARFHQVPPPRVTIPPLPSAAQSILYVKPAQPPRPAAIPAPVVSCVKPLETTLTLPNVVVVPRQHPKCCWPIGNPGTASFRFCGDAASNTKPYCDEHCKLAYVSLRDRKEDAAHSDAA